MSLCYVAGVGTLIMSLVIRLATSTKTSLTKLRGWIGEEKPFDIVTLLSLMGILWILLGVIMTIAKDWFESGFFQNIILRTFLTFIPFFLFKWFMDNCQENK